MAIVIGENSYITIAQADDHMQYVIQGDITPQWEDLVEANKEKYIVSAYREIEEVNFASQEKAEREQLRILEMLFLQYDEYMDRKYLKMAGVKKFKNKEWEETFDMSDRAGDGAFGYNETSHGNSVISL